MPLGNREGEESRYHKSGDLPGCVRFTDLRREEKNEGKDLFKKSLLTPIVPIIVPRKRDFFMSFEQGTTPLEIQQMINQNEGVMRWK